MTLREGVRNCLGRKDYGEILRIAREERRLVRTLTSLLYDGEPLVRWRAVTAVGRLAAAEPGKVKPLVGRFVWWMNEESGGIGWSSGPALGEIGRMAPALLRDTARVLAHFRAERMILAGVFWGCGRMAPSYPSEVKEVVPDIATYLGDPDPEIRGQAAWALGEIADSRARVALEGVTGGGAEILLYDGEELATRRIESISAEALEKISAADHR